MTILKRSLRIFLYLVLVVVAFAGGAAAVLTLTEKGRENLAGLISTVASTPDMTVRLTGLEGIWSGELRLRRVVIEDRDGPWLALQDVAVDWSPAALLSRRFEAERVAAGRIEVARAPLPPSEPPPPKPFSLPLDIAIARIDLPDVALGEALTGGRVAGISASGSASAQAEPLSISADLDVARNDGTAGTLDARIAFAPADNRIDIDVKASEPTNGIIAGLLSLPGGPAVELTVTGQGPAADWSGSGRFLVDGAEVARLDATHAVVDGGSAVTIAGDGAFSPFLPQRFRAVLDGATQFDIAGQTTQGGGLRIERATIAGDAIDVRASGQVDPEGVTDLAVDFTARRGGLPLSFGTGEAPIDINVASATLRAFGAGRTPGLDIAARLSQVATNTVRLDDLQVTLQSDEFDLIQRIGPVVGSARAARLVIDNENVAPLVAGQIRAGLSGVLATDALTISDGTLASDAVDGRFSGAVSLTDGQITLNLAADVLSAALPVAVRPVVGQRMALATSLHRDSQGNTSANKLTLRSESLNADGVARLSEEAIDVDLKGTLKEVGRLAPQAQGAIAFAATAKGPLSQPDVTVSVTGERLVVDDRTIDNLDLSASGTADAANPAADLSLKATVGGETLDGRATLRTSNGRREINDLSLTLGPNRIEGRLHLDDSFVPEGRVTFDLPQLGPLAALALETVEGSASGSVVFDRAEQRPRVQLSARVPNVTRGDLAVDDVVVDASVDDYMAAPAVAGRVQAQTVRSGTTVVRGIDARLSRDGAWTRFDGGATVTDIPARAAGRVRLADGTTTIELSSAEATVRGIRASLARASTIRIADGLTRLDKLALSLGGGSATIDGTAGSTLGLDVALSKVPLSLANAFAPGLDAAGAVSGTVNVSGPASAPTVRYDVDAPGVQTAQTRDAGFGGMTLRSTGTFASNRLTFDASIGDGSGLTLNGGGTVNVAAPVGLSLRFEGGVPFAFLTARLAQQGLALNGTANVSVTVAGTAAAPQIGGTIRTSGARIVDSRSGIAIDQIEADISLASNRATINRLTGSLSSGGRLTASGGVGIDAAQGFPSDLSISLADGRYTDGQVVTTTLSGDVTVRGPLVTAPALAGTINLGRTVITIPERLPPSVSSLNVQHRNATAAVTHQDQALRPAEASGAGGTGLTLDLTVNAPQQIFIQGRGLDAELGGSLRLAGPLSSPQATGQFEMRRGRLSILGRRLTFTRGTLGFSGSLVPYLDMAAESTAQDATVTILVTGPANNPDFDFQSVPVLPQDEVLARLIFGQSMSNLSPLQIAQLADAAAELAGIGGTTSLLTSLRNRLGVDDLDVRTNAQGDTSVAVGKYLNERTYVTIEKGDKAGSGKAAIDLDVGRGFTLRGEAHEDGQTKGGIFFEREY